MVRYNITLAFEQPERLIVFYCDVLQLTVDPDLGDGAFVVGGTSLLIDDTTRRTVRRRSRSAS